MHLLFISFILWSDLVESQLVLVGLRGDESDPVSQLVLLQVLLGQVLQILTRELGSGNNGNDRTVFFNGDSVTQVTGSTFHLDVFNQELSIRSWIEDTVFHWGRDVNGESLGNLLLSGGLDRKTDC